MKIYPLSFAAAAAATVAALYTTLAIILKMYPGQTLKFIGTIHMMPKLDYIKPFVKVTPYAITMGIITHTVAAFLVFLFLALIYNLLQRVFHR